MGFEIISLTLGPVMTNAYLLADTGTGEAVCIDPADEGETIVSKVKEKGWRITSIWLTHAHFDHIAGAAEVVDLSDPPPPVALHSADYNLWRRQGGAALFGMRIDPGPEPTIDLQPGMQLHLGGYTLEVRHTPGHTPGHVIFYCDEMGVAFCGDVVFKNSIGRTDLPGGSYPELMESIRSQVLTLPDETRLLSGHGLETTVGWERRHNPFLQMAR